MSGVFSNQGPRLANGIFGSTRIPMQPVQVTLEANQVVNQPNAPTPTTVLWGSVLGAVTSGSGSGLYVLCSSSLSNGGQAPVGVLAETVETAFGPQTVDIFVNGEFNTSELLFGGADTYATHQAQLNALKIYGNTPITTVTTGTNY
jgi:hypothetical protein